MSNVSYSNPSDRTKKIVGTCLIIGLLAMTPVFVKCAITPGRESVRAAADGAAYELERTPVKGLGLYIFDIDKALTVAARDSRGRSYAGELRVTDAGEDSRGDLYQVTNSDGDYPVCIGVKVDVNLLSDAPTFPTVTVTDGPC